MPETPSTDAAPPRPGDVRPQPLTGVLHRLPSATLSGRGDVAVTGITHDSRHVRPGDLYVARPGEHTHGIAHVTEAVQAGAVAVLTDPESVPVAQRAGASAVVSVPSPREVMGEAAAWTYGDPARDLLVLGVTGTNGKTTTAYLLDAGLRAAGRRTGLLGTIETRVDDRVLPSARTTPEATDLHALFAVMREAGVEAVAMEVSSHALALGRVDGLRVDVAGFTNLSQDHLDFHVTMADYYAAKASLFTERRAARGVVCVDDQWGRRLLAEAGIPCTSTGADVDAEWQRTAVTVTPSGGETVLVDSDGGEHHLTCRLPGLVNVANAALAYVMLLAADVDAAAAAAGIAELPAVPGRMEPVEAGQPFFAYVDYAHTPDALRRVLTDAHDVAGPDRRVLVVIGCGGDRDREKRPLMGQAAASGADVAVLTSDNPRSEDPLAILSEMQAGVPSGAQVVVEADREVAIARAVALARSGDLLLVAGKGHERYQETADGVRRFDDRAVLREAIQAQLAAQS
jgi:UDP-N-acetylmuramoyl-L-alanyl-D-glutamate--2,6-diaminopimelate ligase